MKREPLTFVLALAVGLGLVGIATSAVWPREPGAERILMSSKSSEPAGGVPESGPRLVSQYGPECIPDLVDENGVVMVDYGGEIGRQYNPVTIAQRAIGCYHSVLRYGNANERRRFFDQINWLKHNAIQIGDNGAAYEYNFPWNYGLKPGWRSGLAQGQAVSALIRYYYETGDDSVLPLINQLKKYMLLPTVQGGVVDSSPEGGMWIEEFPSNPPSFVLNGFISATFGLYEFTKLFPQDEVAKDELRRAIDSIKNSLPHYDTGGWMYLDRGGLPYPRANNGYATAYVRQTRTLWEITGEPVFLQTSLRWQSFYSNVNYHEGGNMVADSDGRYSLEPSLQPAIAPNQLRLNYELVSASSSLPDFGVEKRR
jgi:hypothetical protein